MRTKTPAELLSLCYTLKWQDEFSSLGMPGRAKPGHTMVHKDGPVPPVSNTSLIFTPYKELPNDSLNGLFPVMFSGSLLYSVTL